MNGSKQLKDYMIQLKKYKISIIISGGQTGADRGALDFAIKNGIKHGGWCPLGRKSEDKEIPSRYSLLETTTFLYPARTRMNIRDSDATIIFSSDINSKGSLLTTKFCIEMKKPYFTLLLDKKSLNKLNSDYLTNNYYKISKWLNKIKPNILNIAGTRESHCPGIQKTVFKILDKLLVNSGETIEWPPRRPDTLDLFSSFL